MDSLAGMNKAMAFIEHSLPNPVDVGRAAKIAGCSEYHFRRMFAFLSGVPLGEYIRLRKLSMAVGMLQKEGQRVIDVALALGYESPDAFSKAFYNCHHVLPSRVKMGAVPVKLFPPMAFQLTIKGGKLMEYRIVKKETFQIIGIKKRIPLIYEGVNPHMESMWAQLTPERIAQLKSFCNMEPSGILSVSANFTERTEEGSELDQYIGVAVSGNSFASGDWSVLTVPESAWAVFTACGAFPQALQEVWARIYSEWFPSSGYELTGGPEILWNESPDTTKPDYKSEIWIPVKKQTL